MTREVYKHLLGTYGKNPSQWIGFAGVAISILITRVYVVVIVAQVATNIAAGDIESAKLHTLYFFIAYTLGLIIGTAGETLSLFTENKQYGRLMLAYHKKLINKDMSFYRDNQTGYLTSVFRQYLDSTLLFVRTLRGEMLGAFVSLIFPAVVLLFASPEIGLIALGLVIIQVLYIVWSSSQVHDYRRKSVEIARQITGEVADEVTNIVAFKSAGIEPQAESKLANLTEQEVSAFQFRRIKTTLLDLPRGIITTIGISLAVYLIIEGATSNKPESLGLIVLTLTYMFQILRNVAALPELIANYDDLVARLYSTLRYLDSEHEHIQDPDEPKKLVIGDAAINIKNVGFSYPSHSGKSSPIPVFENLTIDIKGGEQVGVVGLSGAGKSTLANLLLRFDDIQEGSITIDGIDIREVRQSELRQKIAYVPQEPLLFHRSVRENIAYFNTEATDEEVIRAAKAAHAHEFIATLPEGYDTTVGERGVKLSGGQKQRIAIARAVLKKAPITVFDEATSALDSESEQIIQRALPEIIGKQTAIVVAHRLSTVAGLDRILVMHKGKVVEQGTHAQLLKRKGRYYSLWQKQTSD